MLAIVTDVVLTEEHVELSILVHHCQPQFGPAHRMSKMLAITDRTTLALVFALGIAVRVVLDTNGFEGLMLLSFWELCCVRNPLRTVESLLTSLHRDMPTELSMNGVWNVILVASYGTVVLNRRLSTYIERFMTSEAPGKGVSFSMAIC